MDIPTFPSFRNGIVRQKQGLLQIQSLWKTNKKTKHLSRGKKLYTYTVTSKYFFSGAQSLNKYIFHSTAFLFSFYFNLWYSHTPLHTWKHLVLFFKRQFLSKLLYIHTCISCIENQVFCSFHFFVLNHVSVLIRYPILFITWLFYKSLPDSLKNTKWLHLKFEWK